MTPRQKVIIQYLSDKMEATAEMVGGALKEAGYDPLSHTYAMGRSVLGVLKKKGLVMRLPELNAWRLTKEGRAYIKAPSNVGKSDE